MRKTFLSLVIIIFAFLGIADASYITYSEFSGRAPPCQPPFDCGTVLKSQWSRVGPLPLSFMGLVYYATIFSIAILFFFDKGDHPEELLLLFTTGGFFFSLYLITIMGLILEAWCLFCLFSAILCVLIFSCTLMVQQAPIKRAYLHVIYTRLCKPLFFLFDAEFVHNLMTTTGHYLGQFAATRFLTAKIFAYTDPQLTKKINGIVFPNPIGLSAGFDYDAQLTDILPSVGFGFATIGTVTHEPYEGNAAPRLGRFPKSKALLVNKGFKSIGAKAIIKKLEKRKFAIPIGISIGSTNKIHQSTTAQIDDIISTFRLFEASQVKHAYYELNVSCPNTRGGEPFTTPKRLEALLQKIDALKIKRPVYLKMPIDLSHTQALSLLDCADEHRIAGIIFGNLTKDKTNADVHPEDRSSWKTLQGNLSGKPTWNRSNTLIQLTRKAYKDRFTIIGTGGVFTPQDAQCKMRLGADLVQLITGMVYEGPQLIGSIAAYLAKKNNI